MALCAPLPACVGARYIAPDSDSDSEWQPGYSTFIELADGTKGRVFTTYLPDGTEGRTTGKVGDHTVDCFADTCRVD